MWVRVPLGVKIFFRELVAVTKKNTPCGTQTHNLQIRSLTRCSVAPTGHASGETKCVRSNFFFAPSCFEKKNAPGGTRTPDPGLIRPMLYQTELPELVQCPRSGSNQGPSDLQSDALPTELHGRTLAETLSCASIFFPRRHNKNKSTMIAPAGN